MEAVTPVTRVCALPRESHPRAEPALLHEWPCDIPYVPEGGMLHVGATAYRVRYRSIAVDEEKATATVIYIVQDYREEPRI
jgi:hypothetical protein